MDENAEPLGRGEPPPRCSVRGSVPVRIALLRSTRLPGGGRSPVSFDNGIKRHASTPRIAKPFPRLLRIPRSERYAEDHPRGSRIPGMAAARLGSPASRLTAMSRTETPLSNHSVEANRRPAAPLDARQQFGSSFSAQSDLPAAVAHLWRSA